ncbi:rod shape-determining protein MreC [Candidatus Uhrbacteria bacterium RIFCSPHIGHO2_01_FULL_63_20]|uniref:Cell shape-determining protein MreC n=1 Tax=Candidatus Uhrbacteria bacterium RIFCSPHIGHO2_01_FULL_63_20 TaxID=1802385 RepID=A0A1F7TKG2_9BACT|nr:MAG: rod shape-determining protein MreC [Candidatus Uhrbacteria bacterium RIFCSPHIGHO2_01_FULL_63_20]
MRRDAARLTRSAAVCVVALAALFFLRSPLLSAFASAARPLAGAGAWVSDRLGWITVGKGEMARRLEERTAQRDALALDGAELERLRDENAELRDRLSFVERTRFDAVQASIVMRDDASQTRRLTLDRGSDDGVVAGVAVTAGNGLYVGKVIAVTAATATVAVAAAPGERTAVTMLTLTRTIGLAEGTGGPLLSMQFIPHDQRIEVNDLVVTSGLEDRVPAGLAVGLVNAVKSDPTSPFQQAMVEPLAYLRRETTLSILLDRASP